MAQRFGGAHSPNNSATSGPGPSPLAGARVRRGRSRGRLMFFLPLPLLFFALGKAPVEMAVDVVAAGILILAAWLLQEGQKAHDAYEDRKIARRPAFPRKIFAAGLSGFGVMLAAMVGLSGLPGALLYGLVAGGLHLLAFGVDPLRDKGMEGIDTFQTDRVAAALDKAEAHLAEMQDAALRAQDRGVMDRVARFQATARAMFRTVEEDPRDLSAARKFLGIYLLSVRDATVKFADLFAATRDPKAREDYYALLDDLEAGFADKREKLLLSDRSDLDIEIEVLRDRLKRDGLTVNSET